MTTALRKPRGSYAKSAARRREIIDAAVEVFSSGGYHKGSLRDVAERVGLSQAGLLHHFPSKENLLEAVLKWRDEDSRSRCSATLSPRGSTSCAAWSGWPNTTRARPSSSSCTSSCRPRGPRPGPPAARLLHRSAPQRRRDHDGPRSNGSPPTGQLQPGVVCDSAGRSVLALMDGLQVQWLLDRHGIDMAAHLRRYSP